MSPWSDNASDLHATENIDGPENISKSYIWLVFLTMRLGVLQRKIIPGELV